MKKKIHPVEQELTRASDPEKAAFFPKFFKTGKGEYGYGDLFLGVTVPMQRKIANAHYTSVRQNEIRLLLDSKYHEVRLTALLMLVLCYQKLTKTEAERLGYVQLYQSKLDRINNWDLVDSSADKILGHYYFDKKRTYLHKLSKSNDLWETRIGILSTFYFIRKLQFEDTLAMCERLLTHKHDLIHKASGWMLREIGNRNADVLRTFLEKYVTKIPRTMLRYAIEKLPEKERKSWLTKK
jgi:3-methyladenine DNA glycosylase AlkD